MCCNHPFCFLISVKCSTFPWGFYIYWKKALPGLILKFAEKKSNFKSYTFPFFLFVFLCFFSYLFCRHITNATLAILKGETVPLDVLQIKVKASTYLQPNIPKTFLFSCFYVYMDWFSSVYCCYEFWFMISAVLVAVISSPCAMASDSLSRTEH